MNARNDLLPCPRCGGGAELALDFSEHRLQNCIFPIFRGVHVVCADCDYGADSYGYRHDEEAIAAWNREVMRYRKRSLLDVSWD